MPESASGDIERTWFILACWPGAEARICAFAEEHRCAGYYPIERRFKPRPQRSPAPREIDESSATPGYLFLALPQYDDGPPFHLFNPPLDQDIDAALRGRTFHVGDILTKDDLRASMRPPPKGIIGFLGVGGPQAINPAIVQSLREREARGDFDQVYRHKRLILPKHVRIGALVSIEDGPWAAIRGAVRGVIERIRQIKGRIIASVHTADAEIFGNQPVVDVPIDFLSFRT